jgi:hypothetical protein
MEGDEEGVKNNLLPDILKKFADDLENDSS